jgi:hypothetical protein
MNALSSVPRTGFEPARPFGHHHLKVACLPISTPGQTPFLTEGAAKIITIYLKSHEKWFLFQFLKFLQRADLYGIVL